MHTKRVISIKKIAIIFLFFIFFFGIVFIVNNLVTNHLNPENSKAAADLSSLYSPILDPSKYVVTNPYNINVGGDHWGIDFAPRSSQSDLYNIYSAGSGVVTDDAQTRKYCASDCGNYITIKHSSGLYTRYQHLAETFVRIGQTVDQNTKIGIMGNTGHSTGTHLHFEITTVEMKFVYNDTSLFLNPTSVYNHVRSSTPNYTSVPTKVACGNYGCMYDSDCDGYDYNKPGTATCNEREDGDASKQRCSRVCTYGYADGDICTCATTAPTASPTPLPTTTPDPTTTGECLKMDTNGDSLLNYIDLQTFIGIYNKTCTNDTSNIDPNGCGGQDNNKDGKIDYKDLAALVSNYSPKVTSCVGMKGL